MITRLLPTRFALLLPVAALSFALLTGCNTPGGRLGGPVGDPADDLQVATTNNSQIHLAVTPGAAVVTPRTHKVVAQVTAVDGNPILVNKSGPRTARITIVPDPNHPGPHQIDLEFTPDPSQKSSK